MFGKVSRAYDVEACTNYVVEECKKRDWPYLYVTRPEWTAEEFEQRVLASGAKGAKVYLNFSPMYIPSNEIRIFDFIPHHQLEVLNQHGWVLMLHIPRAGRLGDPVNIAEMIELNRKYPKVKTIIAHIGRAYADKDMGDAFERLEEAMAFGEEVDTYRIRIPNRVDIFGDQLILNEEDESIGTEADLLPIATMLSLWEVPPLVEKHNGVCYPAHIDREANGIVSILGTVPETPDFGCVELRDLEKREEYLEKFPILQNKTVVCGSDAHYLWDIRDADAYFDLEDEPYSGDLVRHQLFLRLKGVI
jgi:hypothetical protein